MNLHGMFIFSSSIRRSCVVCVSSGKRLQGNQTWKITNGKRGKLHKQVIGGQTSQSAGMRKHTALLMLSTVTHKDIPRQLHVVTSSWLSTDQSALVCCGQRASDDNLENDKSWVGSSYRVARFSQQTHPIGTGN